MTTKPTYEELERRVQELEEAAASRGQTEDALAEERQRLLALLDGLPAFVYLQAPDHSIRFANRFFKERFGSPGDKPCHEVIRGRKEPCETCPTFRVFDTRSPQVWEWDHTPGGHTYQIYEYPFSDVDGSPLVLELGIDITDRKRAQEASRESEKRYRDLYEDAPNAYFSVDAAHGSIVMCNKAAERMLGYDKASLLAARVLDLYADTVDGKSRAQAVFERFKRGEPIRDIELQMKHKDGHPIWASLSVELVRDAAGDVLESRSMAIDISERKRAEEALREKEYIIQSSSSIIATADLQGNMTYGNPAFLRAWRFDDAKEFLGRPFSDFWLVEHRLDEIMQALLGEGTWFDEIEAKRKDGSLFDVQVLAAMVSDKEGNPVALTSTSVDVTDRKRAEQERERLLAELQDAALQVKTLSGMLPICSSCKKIRDDTGYWNQIEVYIRDHSEAEFSHGICPECFTRLYGEEL